MMAIGSHERAKILRPIMKAQRNRCYLCDCEMTLFIGYGNAAPHAATIDHIVPLSHGGTWDRNNLAACCYECNQIKGSRQLPNKKNERRQIRAHDKRKQRFAQFQTSLHCTIPLRGGWI